MILLIYPKLEDYRLLRTGVKVGWMRVDSYGGGVTVIFIYFLMG